MSNPYTQPSISGYNSSPPSDDGSETTANAIKWSNHIDKIGDPLRDYIDAVSANVLTAFGKVLGGNIVSKAANYTVLPADQGSVFIVTGGATLTLPPVANVGEPYVIGVINGALSQVTVDGNSSETINGATSITLEIYESAILFSDGSEWHAIITRETEVNQTKVVKIDESKSSDTTLADSTYLAGWVVQPDTPYSIDGIITITEAGGDFKCKFDWTGGSGGPFVNITMNTVGESTDVTQKSTSFSDTYTFSGLTSGVIQIRVRGWVRTATNSHPNMDFQWAQNSSSASATILETSSYITLKEQSY